MDLPKGWVILGVWLGAGLIAMSVPSAWVAAFAALATIAILDEF